jgi:hypothetical protein
MPPGMPERPCAGMVIGRLFRRRFLFGFRFLFLEAGFILPYKCAEFGIVVFLAVERVIKGAFRILFRHGGYIPFALGFDVLRDIKNNIKSLILQRLMFFSEFIRLPLTV